MAAGVPVLLVSMVIGLASMEKYCLDVKHSLHLNNMQCHAADESS